MREWNRIVVEVITSWQRITEFVFEKIDPRDLQSEDVRLIANAIIGRWLFPKDKIKTTSTAELKDMYLPVQLMPELLGEFEAVLVKKAYDKIRPSTKILCDADLIEKVRIGNQIHYKPTDNLLKYCMDCSQKLKEIV